MAVTLLRIDDFGNRLLSAIIRSDIALRQKLLRQIKECMVDALYPDGHANESPPLKYPLDVPRLLFANHLRGIASICVVVSHLLVFFWLARGIVSEFTFTTDQAGWFPALVLMLFHPWFNLGPFGVALFFLVSGLVVPISLLEHSRMTFISARLLRVYPTYAVALSLEVVVLGLNAYFWHRPFTWSVWAIVSNFLLIQDLVNQPGIDLVNWTLVQELHFYVIVTVLANTIRQGSDIPIILVAVFALIINYAYREIPLPLLRLVGEIGMSFMFISFMLIGTLFNFHYRKKIGLARLVFGVTVLLGGFATSGWYGQLTTDFSMVLKNYLCAFGVFSTLYIVRNYVPRSAVLDKLAALSFPLYLIHCIFGYSLLRVMMVSGGYSYTAAISVTLPVVLTIAWGLHRLVEIPTLALGRRLRRHIAAV